MLANIDEVIYDGRRAGHTRTIGPPINIFHPIFDQFTRMVNDPGVQPTVQDLKLVYDLMYDAGEIQQEHSYRDRLRLHLGRILETPIPVGELPDGTCPDGFVTLDVCDAELPYMIFEAKQEMGEGGSDPATQAGLYMRCSWIHESVGYNRIYLIQSCVTSE